MSEGQAADRTEQPLRVMVSGTGKMGREVSRQRERDTAERGGGKGRAETDRPIES